MSIHDDEEEWNDDFENEEEKDHFKDMFERYKHDKKMMNEGMQLMMEFQTLLNIEFFIKRKHWVMVPEKFTGQKNCPVCMIHFDRVFDGTIAIVLN